MHGMVRHLFITASALSLLLCTATLALWVRSYWLGDSMFRRSFDSKVLSTTFNAIQFDDGRIRIFYRSIKFDTSMAFKRSYPRSERKIFLSEPPHRYGFQTVLSHFALHIRSASSVVEDFDGYRRVRVNGVHQDQRVSVGKYSVHVVEVIFPIGYLWLLFLLFGSPAIHQICRRRSSRIPAGHCARCGYDLRGSEGRCPECGLEFFPNLKPIASPSESEG